MQTHSRCATTVSKNFTTHRSDESVLDSPGRSVQNALTNSKKDAVTFPGTNRAAASRKSAVRRCLPVVATGNALPPHFFIGARRMFLWGSYISFIIPFLNQGRTLLGNAAQLFRMIGTIGAIMSSAAPVSDGSPPLMSPFTSPPNRLSTFGSYIPRCNIFIFFRMPLGGNSRIAGLQAVFFAWPVS